MSATPRHEPPKGPKHLYTRGVVPARIAFLKSTLHFRARNRQNSLLRDKLQVAAAREGLELAERELAQAQRRYKAGVATSIEVTDAQTRLQRARDNQIIALFSHNLARVDLSTAMGTIQDLVNNF